MLSNYYSNTTLVKVKFQLLDIHCNNFKNSNTTLVKVKLAIKFFATVIVVNSNTTLVKVKFYPYGSDIGKT